MRKFLKLSVLSLAFLSIGSEANAITANASATVVNTISITQSTALNFGKFASTGTAGTVTVTTAGARSGNNVTLLTTASTHAAGSFAVSGAPNATYTVNLQTTAVTLTSGANTMSIAANQLTANPSGSSGTLSGSGTQTLNVGGVLSVAANQAAGTYTGTYSIDVVYN